MRFVRELTSEAGVKPLKLGAELPETGFARRGIFILNPARIGSFALPRASR
jgi:hypothetical protein